MSSPSKRRSQSGTPRRSTRSSQAPQSSPAKASSQNVNTLRNAPPSQLASSPLFYQSSSPAPDNADVSSPLRQNTESQSQNPRANGSAVPSSPLRQMTHSQTPRGSVSSQNDGDRTPRASGSRPVGGTWSRQTSGMALTNPRLTSQTLPLLDMRLALVQADLFILSQISEAKAVTFSSALLPRLEHDTAEEVISTRKPSVGVPAVAAVSF